MVHLVTGYAGKEHITSDDAGSFNAAFFGKGCFVMNIGEKFKASIINNNSVRILDGDGLMYGRHFRIKPNTYEDLLIQTGTAGVNRIDLIVMTYEKNSNDGTESCYLEVITGEEAVNPKTPSFISGDILLGVEKSQFPLYRVNVKGVVLSSVTRCFAICNTYKELYDEMYKAFQDSCSSYLGSLNVLDSLEEISANTEAYNIAGALALKEVNSNLISLSNNTDAKYGALNSRIDYLVYLINESLGGDY